MSRVGRFFFLVGMLLVFAAAGASLARWVIHGPVKASSLEHSVESSSDLSGTVGTRSGTCQRTVQRAIWTCTLEGSHGRGNVTYSITVKPGSSCWTGVVLVQDPIEPLPARIDGCVHLWQWSLADIF